MEKTEQTTIEKMVEEVSKDIVYLATKGYDAVEIAHFILRDNQQVASALGSHFTEPDEHVTVTFKGDGVTRGQARRKFFIDRTVRVNVQ